MKLPNHPWEILKIFGALMLPRKATYQLYFNSLRVGVIKQRGTESESHVMRGYFEPTAEYADVKWLFDQHTQLMAESFRLRDESQPEIDATLQNVSDELYSGKLKIHSLKDDTWGEVAQILINGKQISWRWGRN